MHTSLAESDAVKTTHPGCLQTLHRVINGLPGSDTSALSLAPYTVIARDAEHRLDAATVRQLALEGELPLRGDDSRGLGYTSDTVWLYFALENTTAQPLRRVLIIHYPLLDHIRLHRFEHGQPMAVRNTGDRLPFTSRDLPLLDPNLM